MDRIRLIVFVVVLGLALLLVPLLLWASAPPSGAYAADLLTAIEPAALARVAPEPASDVEVYVSEPVTPGLSTPVWPLPTAEPWKPGDPVYEVPRQPPAYAPEVGLQGQGEVYVSEPVKPGLSPPVWSLPTVKPWKPGKPIREVPRQSPAYVPEVGLPEVAPPLLSAFSSLRTPSLSAHLVITGITATGAVPPDPNGDVGPNHYIQMVNSSFAIWDKTGTQLQGPTFINSLWTDGTKCQTCNDGDPIVLYDRLADRWLMSQLAVCGGAPYFQCIAISQTADPMGAWHTYSFNTGGATKNDYPKFGVWPDGYYMGANEAGFTAYVFDRANMLTGAAATFQRINVPGQNMMLPSDLDGPTPPPAGAPNYFYTMKTGNVIEIYDFHVDWVTPANSTFAPDPASPLISSGFIYDVCPCNPTTDTSWDCIPQPGTTQCLDAIGEWPMHRLQYRNHGTHESLVSNFTVDTDAAAGTDHAAPHWFELRKVGAGNWTIHDEGTISPDSTERWMGSAAMDQDGNIVVGYSVSNGTTLSPTIRYATRLATDPPGTVGAEVTLIAGTGVQTGTNRWGDYSAMSVDPSDDCTFWYTNEYYQTTSGGGWSTHIGSFKMPPVEWFVNSTADTGDGNPGDGICDTGTVIFPTGICTLRAAIEEANATVCVSDTIKFNIPVVPDPFCDNVTGVCTIRPGSALPVITNTVMIDGYTQPGAAPATGATNAVLKIVLDGSLAGNGVNGLVLQTDNSTIRGLNIHGFKVTDLGNNDSEGNGIVIRQGMTNTIAGNFIGTNVAGTACVGNGGSGVLIGGGFDSTAGADRNTVGGTDPADRNLITCNGFQAMTVTSGSGVTIWANLFYTTSTVYSADNNTVVGNYIGTDVNGTSVPLIGTDIYTLTHSGNTGAGVRIVGGQANTVGGTTVAERNILSGNELDGVRIEAAAFDDNIPPTLTRAANSNIVQGNYIGTDVAGTGDLGNVNAGVHINGLVDDADNNLIGGTTGTTPGGACSGACNLISGNGGSGVSILGGKAISNTVQGNYIGTNPAGTTAIPNDANGINITDAMTNTIGGTTDTARNLISGNGAHGISIVNTPKTWVPLPGTGDVFLLWGDGEASGNIIQGNYIGTEVSGTAALRNMLSGVQIMDAAGNTVGGATPAERNIISGNGQNGILFMTASPPGNTETDVVTAAGTDAGLNPVSDSDSATVTITDRPGAIEVTKTADPTNVAAVGDVVTFTIRITNTSGVEVMIKRLSDSFHLNLDHQGTCAVPQTLAAGGFYTCTFSAPVYGLGGDNSETDVVTASGTDANGNFVIDSDSATVTIGDPPPIRVTKTAYPTSLTPPGGTVNFTVTVENISGASVTINKVWDSKHGILCGVPPVVVVLNPGDTLQCLYSATVSGTTGNKVEGNYIGTDVNGTAALPNQAAGVVITSPDNAIGGATAAQGNLISGNVREGVILLGADATGNSLWHNLIGTQADGTSPLGNGFHGVLLDPSPSDNAIGSSTGMSNTIAYNGRDGVFVVSGTGNQILSNSIFTNTELGIDLGSNGVTANDDTDPDGGANTLQNYPVLTSAAWDGGLGLISIQGALNSISNTNFTIQFFSSPTCDPSGFGEGQTFLVQGPISTDGSGHVIFGVMFLGTDLTGQFVTATATDPYSNTSEFSNCIPVPSAPALSINKRVQDLNGGNAKPGDTLRYTINYTNTGNAPATGVFITDTYSTYCVTRTNVTNGGFPNHDDDGTRLRWPATGGIVLAAGASGSVRYDCTLQDTFAAGTYSVDNTAILDSGQTDPNCSGETPSDEDPEDGCDLEQVTVTVAPVLTTDKECTPAAGNIPGDTVHCVIQYANTGDAAATGATIVDDYDESNGDVPDASITGSAHFAVGTDNGNTITWDGTVTIPVGESGQVEYDYTLAGPATFPDGTTPVTNTATITSTETGPVQDAETIQVTVVRELTIDKQGQDLNGGSAEPGDTLRYTISYANSGNVPLTGVFITDDYSALCATISIISNGDFLTVSDAAGVLRWPDTGGITLAALASGAVSFDCTLQASFPLGTLQVTNVSTIDSNETGPQQDTETLSTGCYDFNSNGTVDVGDIMAVVARWRMTESDPGWDARYDVNGDGCITVVDIMMVAAQWGQTCP